MASAASNRRARPVATRSRIKATRQIAPATFVRLIAGGTACSSGCTAMSARSARSVRNGHARRLSRDPTRSAYSTTPRYPV